MRGLSARPPLWTVTPKFQSFELYTFHPCSNTLNQAILLLLFFFCIADVMLTIDCVQYYFANLYKITGLWAGHFYTVSSLALKASLYHSRNPDKPSERLFIRHLDNSTWNSFKATLHGGFSTVQAKYSIADQGYLQRPEPGPHETPGIIEIPPTIRFNKSHDHNW